MVPKVILFDIGNVIIPITNDKTVSYWATISRQDSSDIKRKMDFSDPVYVDFERGDIPAARFRNYLSRKLGYSFQQKEFDRGWNAMLDGLMPGIEDMLAALSSNYRLAALSNTNEIHEYFMIREYPSVFSHFEKLFLSNRLKIRKPDRAVYQSVLDYYKIQPGELIFLDDKPENIQSAKELGIKTILVKSGTDIQKGLTECGVL